MLETEYKSGDRVIYTRLQRPQNTEWPATYVRSEQIQGRTMHVISLDAQPRPRTVGAASIRRA